MSFLLYPFITTFTRHASMHTDRLGESFTLFSPMESHPSLVLLQEASRLLIRTLHLNIDGRYPGHFILIMPLTLVDSI